MPIKKGMHTPEQLEASRANLVKARAAQRVSGGETTEKRRAASKENIKAAQAASAAQHKVKVRNRGRAVKNREVEVTVRADVGRMGPAMLALPNDRWRRFALALLSQGTRDATAAYRSAGFQGNANTAPVQAMRIVHDQRMIAALHEEGKNHVRTGQLLDAMGAVDRILANDRHRDQARVALGVYDRAGLHALSEQKVTVERLGDDPRRLERIMLLLERLGMKVEDVRNLVGRRLAPAPLADSAGVTDADYEELPDADR